MPNPLYLLKTKYQNLKSDKHFGEIFTGSAKVFGAKVIATLIGLGTSVITARYYGAEIVGIVAIINSFFAIAMIFTIMGTTTSILRLVPEYFVKYSATSAYLLYKKVRNFVIILSLAGGLIVFFTSGFIAGNIFGRPDITFLFQIGSLVLVFKSLQSFSMQGIRAAQNINAFTIIQLLGPVTYAILLVVFTFYFYNIYNPVYLQYFIAAFVAVISLYIIKITFKTKIHTDDVQQSISFKEKFKISFPMFLTSSMMVVMGQTDTLMIGIFRTEAEVGYYAIGLKIAMMTTFVLAAINTVVAPKFSELFNKGKIDELFKVAKKSTKLIFWSLMPLIFIFIFFGKWVIIKLYGSDFEPSYYLLLILSVGLFFNAISGSVGYFMNMCGYEKVVRNLIFLSFIINITLNLILIPIIGIYGAAISTSFNNILWNVLLTLYIRKKYQQTFIYIPLISFK